MQISQIFNFFVVIREVILQKMAPILDPVNFFSVLTLLADCGQMLPISIYVYSDIWINCHFWSPQLETFSSSTKPRQVPRLTFKSKWVGETDQTKPKSLKQIALANAKKSADDILYASDWLETPSKSLKSRPGDADSKGYRIWKVLIAKRIWISSLALMKKRE